MDSDFDIIACPREFVQSCENLRLKYIYFLFYKTEVRLVGSGTVASQGRVEVFHNGVWGTICNSYWYYNWGMAQANVVCRQLGYDGAIVVPSSTAFGSGKGVTWMNRLSCNGDEKSIKACRHAGWGVESCNRRYHASVICKPLGD